MVDLSSEDFHMIVMIIIITVIYMALFQVDQSANIILISEINEFLVFS